MHSITDKNLLFIYWTYVQTNIFIKLVSLSRDNRVKLSGIGRFVRKHDLEIIIDKKIAFVLKPFGVICLRY